MEFIFAVVVFFVDLWAILQTLQCKVSTGTKLAWTLIIFLLPVLGLFLWLFFGPRRA